MGKDEGGDQLTDLPEEILKEAAKVGIEEAKRSGTYFQLDQKVILNTLNDKFKDKLELLPIHEALKKYKWLGNYYWKIVPKNKDAYTQDVAEDEQGGYFMRFFEGAEVTFPLQSCLMVSEGQKQKVHNIIIAEKGSNARIITGCSKHPTASSGTHLGVSEIYVKEGATLHFTMIHEWGKDTIVRPRTATQIGDSANFVSNYISLKPVSDVQMYPVAYCKGKDSVASLNSLIFTGEDSHLDIGSRIVFEGDGSRGEIVSKSIAKDSAELIVRGMLEGNCERSKGHLECQSLLLDKGLVHAIPELIARASGAELSHEASVGKIAEKELTYLMSRGLSEDAATAMIVRGFLDVSILGLPEELSKSVKDLITKTVSGI